MFALLFIVKAAFVILVVGMILGALRVGFGSFFTLNNFGRFYLICLLIYIFATTNAGREDLEVLEGDTFINTEFSFTGKPGEPRKIVNFRYATPELDQPSLDKDGHVVAANLGVLARNRVIGMLRRSKVKCRRYFSQTGPDAAERSAETPSDEMKWEYWECRSHLGKKSTTSASCARDPQCGELSTTLVREGLAWSSSKDERLKQLQFQACEQRKGIWAGGPRQIRPDVWASRGDTPAEQLYRHHCSQPIPDVRPHYKLVAE